MRTANYSMAACVAAVSGGAQPVETQGLQLRSSKNETSDHLAKLSEWFLEDNKTSDDLVAEADTYYPEHWKTEEMKVREQLKVDEVWERYNECGTVGGRLWERYDSGNKGGNGFQGEVDEILNTNAGFRSKAELGEAMDTATHLQRKSLIRSASQRETFDKFRKAVCETGNEQVCRDFLPLGSTWAQFFDKLADANQGKCAVRTFAEKIEFSAEVIANQGKVGGTLTQQTKTLRDKFIRKLEKRKEKLSKARSSAVKDKLADIRKATLSERKNAKTRAKRKNVDNIIEKLDKFENELGGFADDTEAAFKLRMDALPNITQNVLMKAFKTA